MRRLIPAAVAVALLVAVAFAFTGCGRRPDTGLHPGPPLVSYAPLRHPFQGARLFHDRDTAAARWQTANRAGWLDPITTQPQALWVNSPQDVAGLPAIARQAGQQGTLPVLVTYYLPNRGCSKFKEGAPTAAAYDQWIGQLLVALGTTHAAIIMEPDAIPADCFDAQRAEILTRGVKRLADAGQSVYLDAGHSHWKASGEVAERLINSGIQYAEGFSVNVSNRQTTQDSYDWGRELSDLVGDRDFVIDTSRNGLGPPPDDPSRDDEWCNPPRQALGDAPTTAPDRAGLAALLWIKAPGESDGPCGGETGYLFSWTQARNLIANSPSLSQAQRAEAADARISAANHA
jgi:endoglucanase